MRRKSEAIIRQTNYTTPVYGGTSPIGFKCDGCGKFFSEEHAARKPKFCEDCGCKLLWEV